MASPILAAQTSPATFLARKCLNHHPRKGDMHVVLKMDVVQHLMERLRPIVGLKSWDYCVLWKLSEDGRFIEWVGCCCGGSNHMNSGGDDQELAFPSFSYEIQCRDANFQHPRTKSCDLLAQLPSSLPSDSGIHAHTMISNQVRWLNLCNSSNSDHISEENIGTRVLIPVSVGLVELFVAKQVSEDQSAIDFVASQFNMSMQQQPDLLMAAQVNDQNDSHDHFQLPPVSPATMLEHLNLSSATISEYQTPFLQQFNYDEKANNYAMDLENGRSQEMDALQRNMNSQEMDALQRNMNVVGRKKREGADKDGVNRSDSVSDCSDVNDEDDEPKNRRKNGKGPSKNLDAERKRRKKLNERLYALRALVPNISKLDRAAILVDAIDYVTELQKQVQDLQNQLVESSDDEGDANNRSTIIQDEVLHGNGPKSAHVTFSNGPHFEASTNGSIDISKQNQEVEKKCDKGQQMEPQVEVAQLDENEFFVKVFCEQKPGGFRKLMDGFNALGLEVTNVNMTSFRCLVSNVFRVEKRDSEMVEADHLKESLLELTRYPPRAWLDIIPKAHGKVDCGGVEHHHNHHFSDLHNHQPKSHFHRHLRN